MTSKEVYVAESAPGVSAASLPTVLMVFRTAIALLLNVEAPVP